MIYRSSKKVGNENILGWGKKTILKNLIRFGVVLAVGFLITFVIDLYRLQQPEFQMARNAVLESELVAYKTGGIRYVERTTSASSHESTAEGKTAMYLFFVRGNKCNLHVEVNLSAPAKCKWRIQ